ncbi:MAG: M15 family metallopeptidase [Aureispira sp.]|nr:M15 family metallopeptidase [Aureispira sp.]
MNYYILIISIGISLLACQAAVDNGEASNEQIVQDTKDTIAKDTIKPQQKDTLPKGIQQLLKAYPQQLKKATPNSIIWADGTEMFYDDRIKNKSFRQLLDEPDLQDQLENMPYNRGKMPQSPARNDDPGRIRYEPFFLKMYGESKDAVRKNLVEVDWLPQSIGQKLLVTTINEVDKKVIALSAELEKHPELHKYLTKPGGTFNWRKIAGTDRMSMHSFGMTIDVNVGYSDYWRWHIKDGDTEGTKVIEYRNRIPIELVEIFEKYGFIWGGKWYHYDSMHFEYRPELFQ